MKTFTFTFNEEQINTIAGSLSELPYKVAKPLFDDIIKQFQAQQVQETTEAEETPSAE